MGELCVFSDKGDDAPCIVYIIVKDKVCKVLQNSAWERSSINDSGCSGITVATIYFMMSFSHIHVLLSQVDFMSQRSPANLSG